MTNKPSYAEVIQLAIDNEQKAADLYAGMAKRADSPAAKRHFEQLANMERGHKMKLETMDVAFFEARDAKPPQDLKISDYLVDVELKPDSSYQDTLLYAAKCEKAAAELYTDLASAYAAAPEVSRMFQVLAQEEAHHKFLIEREYDDKVYREL
jgi:rubrerythrin